MRAVDTSVEPASAHQVLQARDGTFVEVDGDVTRALKALDPNLHLRYSTSGKYYVVYWRDEAKGKDHLVLTAQTCDMRIVARAELIGSGLYSYADELERLDSQAKADHEYKISQQIGDIGERLAHAIRQDLGAKQRIFLPGVGYREVG